MSVFECNSGYESIPPCKQGPRFDERQLEIYLEMGRDNDLLSEDQMDFYRTLFKQNLIDHINYTYNSSHGKATLEIVLKTFIH